MCEPRLPLKHLIFISHNNFLVFLTLKNNFSFLNLVGNFFRIPCEIKKISKIILMKFCQNFYFKKIILLVTKIHTATATAGPQLRPLRRPRWCSRLMIRRQCGELDMPTVLLRWFHCNQPVPVRTGTAKRIHKMAQVFRNSI